MADEGEECPPVAALDEIIGHRITLGIQAHHLARIFLEAEQAAHRNLLIAVEDLPHEFVVAVAFEVVFGEHAAAFIGPARHRLAEVEREHRMRDFVGQHAGQEPVERALDLHLHARDAGRTKME